MTFFDIHTHIRDMDNDIRSIISILPLDTIPEGVFSVGCHPWFVNKSNCEEQMDAVMKKAMLSNCIAIGECGLDRPTFRKTGSSVCNEKSAMLEAGERLQRDIFCQHIDIANSTNNPLIIHCVRAYQELLEIRKKAEVSTPWIIHGFRGSREIAESLIGYGILLSFGKVLISGNASNAKIKDIFRDLPEESILLESDNVDVVSCDIRNIYQAAAEIRDIPVEKLQTIIRKNLAFLPSFFFS